MVRRRIFGSGAVAALAVVVASLIMLSPLLSARGDLRRISKDGLSLQSQLADLSTTSAAWQLYMERSIDKVQPGVASDPKELVQGGALVATQTKQAAVLGAHLRRVGLTSDANDLRAAMAAFNSSLNQLNPIAAGTAADPATLRAAIDDERNRIEEVWRVMTEIDARLSSDIIGRDTVKATDDLGLGVWMFFVGRGIVVVLIVVGTVIFGRRAGRRTEAQHRLTRRHEYEARLQEALEMTKSEAAVFEVLGQALGESVPELRVEMLVADSSRAHLRRALTNGESFDGCGVASPLDCPATTVGHVLLFPSSRALNACPYLKDRPSGDCSAACLPVSISGHTVGVTHAVGVEGRVADELELEVLAFTTRRGAERIAMIRSFEISQTQAQTDPLTGLLNRRSLENAVRDLGAEGIPYAVAYGDLDHFKILNDTYGHEAGDKALRLFSRVLRDSLRPAEIAARYGGEEFVIVLPDCDITVAVGVLERVRENLALALSAGGVPPFTVTFGVASSAYAPVFDDIVLLADRALLAGKEAGRNRVLVAEFPTDHPQPDEITDRVLPTPHQ